MTKTKKPVSKKIPSSSGSTGYSGSSGTSSSDDSKESAAEIARRIDREQLGALLGAVKSSRNTFDGDVTTIRSAVVLIDNSSPVVSKMSSHITTMLSDSTYDDDYDSVIRSIQNALS
ncbi:MAG: hypothetical protein J6U54_22910 [Clostridiales bacterium]|nr:hypothetical protein [Clostridiales bacterium]